MCSYQTLFHADKSGYVIRCAGCENIQLTFGNLIINFAKAEFNQFIRIVKKQKAEHQSSVTIDVKSIILPTACEGVRLSFSFRELHELDNMLDAADTELQSLELIELFKEDKIS